MADSLAQLESQRATLLAQFHDLGDFRPGSITTTSGKCGKPSCHCAKSKGAVHGPNFRVTRKAQGKAVTETFPTTEGFGEGAARGGRVSPLPGALPRTGPGE